MGRSNRARPVLASGLLLFGGGVAGYAAQLPVYNLDGLGRAALLLLGAAALQVAIAAALWFRVPGASGAALLVLAGQWAVYLLVLAFIGPIGLLTAVPVPESPMSVYSPHPVAMAALVALGVGTTLVYALAASSLLPAGWLRYRRVERPELSP